MDLVDGTPILDMKPYIPAYDSPQSSECIRYQGSTKAVMRLY